MTNWIEIKDFNTPELGLYASLSEVQLLRYYEPKPGLFIAESPKVIQRAVNAGYEPISFLWSVRIWKERRRKFWRSFRKPRFIQQSMMC